MTSSRNERPANRLAAETSPYLLQHAHNPVDWYPWGEEALRKAREEDKPIFLSIGYSACHWCHVMERESFEDEGIAGQLERDWVAIKVDREERPDLDEIYMKAVQAMTGAGGWPMSVFLTPQLEPFFGGTYFPPYSKFGRPGFADVLRSLSAAWQNDRAKVTEQGSKMAQKIAAEGRANLFAELDPDILDESFRALEERFDETWGGFGQAPKFPHAMDLRILMRHWKRTGDERALHMATFTMDRMAEGGVYDQLAGGFHRYSTDDRWLIPHFEKMLYDNALLVPAYLEAFLITEEKHYARVAGECCDWMLREMSTPEGGIASTQDADTEGVEGKYFVWTPDELTEVLGAKRGARAAAYFGVTDDGNFEDGQSALWRQEPESEVAAALQMSVEDLRAEMTEAKRSLLESRLQRTVPGTDDKILASWNGLAISALAQSYQVLEEERFLEPARKAADYVLQGMRQENGHLYATARHGRAHLNAYLDDYVFMVQALLDLFESDFDERWLEEAIALAEIVQENFEDPVNGGYYTTSDDHEQLIARLKNPHDGALPSGSGVHALNLSRLAEITGDSKYQDEAWTTIRSLGSMVNRFPVAFSQLLQAVDFAEAGPLGIVISAKSGSSPAAEMLRTVRGRFLPQRVVVRVTESGPRGESLGILKGREPAGPEALAYVCRNATCALPAGSVEQLAQQLQ